MFDIKSYTEANSLEELFKRLDNNPEARIVAGGTDILIKNRDRDQNYLGKDLIGITRIPEMHGIYLDDDETLCIGAASSFTTVANNEWTKKLTNTLAYAVSTVGGPQTRNAGTIGGNVCNGATSGDSGATLFAYNAILEVQNSRGIKNIPIQEFYLGPGKVNLEQGDILVKIKIKKENYHQFKGHYTKFAQRKALDIANLSCATLIKETNGVIEDLRIAYGVAGPTPIRATVAEEFAIGKELSETVLSEIGKKCLESTKARTSWRASKEYREHLIQLLPVRNIATALGGQ